MVDPRTPILVGAAAVEQRLPDPEAALEPVALMAEALGLAADDAGSRDLLVRADAIAVPRGFWDYPDPGRLLANRLGAARARSLLAEIGVLQTTLFGRATQAIREGRADVVLVAGGEAKYRDLRARIAGLEASVTRQDAAVPDEVWRPGADIVSPLEIERGLAAPVAQFAVIENALRAAEGQGLESHRREVAALWAALNRIAGANPHAAFPEPRSVEEIATPSSRNRMLAFPYTKLHNSQWNVDQAAGLVFCSAEAARAARVPEERWIFPRAIVESNHMLPLSARREPHRCPGFRLAAERALELAGLALEEIAHLELYSCFPAAVRVQTRELGIPEGRPLSVSGGMPFAGGPLNNFVLQAAVRLAEVLRADPGSHALLTAVSGILTKQGVSLWSTTPGAREFGFEDVAGAVARATPSVDVVAQAEGEARVVSYTVTYHEERPLQGVLLCDLPDGRRTLATTADGDWMRAMETEEFCGRSVKLGAGGALSAA